MTDTPLTNMDDEVRSANIHPHSIEAEQSLLGGLLLENAAWDRVADLLSSSDFYRYEHQLIFRAIAALINEIVLPTSSLYRKNWDAANN